MGLGELLVPMRGEPDPRQRTLLAQHEMRVKHRGAFLLPVREQNTQVSPAQTTYGWIWRVNGRSPGSFPSRCDQQSPTSKSNF